MAGRCEIRVQIVWDEGSGFEAFMDGFAAAIYKEALEWTGVFDCQMVQEIQLPTGHSEVVLQNTHIFRWVLGAHWAASTGAG